MPEEGTILVFGDYGQEAVRGKKSGAAVGEIEPMVTGRRVKAEDVERSMRELVPLLDKALAPVEGLGGWRIDSIQVAIGVSGEGTVGILGTGVKVGATAGITLTIKKKDAGK